MTTMKMCTPSRKPTAQILMLAPLVPHTHKTKSRVQITMLAPAYPHHTHNYLSDDGSNYDAQTGILIRSENLTD
jgi:hypothetical protein